MVQDWLTYLSTLSLIYSEHEWFKTELPTYLFPAGSDVDASIIDTEVIQDVCEVIYTYSSKIRINEWKDEYEFNGHFILLPERPNEAPLLKNIDRIWTHDLSVGLWVHAESPPGLLYAESNGIDYCNDL